MNEATSETGQVPWQERKTLDKRNEFIEKWLKHDSAFSDLCEAYEISRKTGYKWVGRMGLEDRSRAPLTHPQAIEDEIAQQVIAERERHPSWGARKIQESLRRQKPAVSWPAASSIGELLKRQGLKAKRREAPHVARPPFRPPIRPWSQSFPRRATRLNKISQSHSVGLLQTLLLKTVNQSLGAEPGASR